MTILITAMMTVITVSESVVQRQCTKAVLRVLHLRLHVLQFRPQLLYMSLSCCDLMSQDVWIIPRTNTRSNRVHCTVSTQTGSAFNDSHRRQS